jgi:hypothetical protein
MDLSTAHLPRLFLVTLEPWLGGSLRDSASAVARTLQRMGSHVRPLGKNLWLVRSREVRAHALVDALQHAIDVRDRVIAACVDGVEIDGRFTAEDRRWVHEGRAADRGPIPRSVVA